MSELDFCNNGIRVKLAETDEELKQARKLRYESIVLFHRKKDDVSFEQSYNDVDLNCDHLIAVDVQNDRLVGTYRLVTKKHLPKLGKFTNEASFNVDDLKNYDGNVLELGRLAVHPDYRDGFVIKMLFRGLFEYVKLNDIKLLFGFIGLPNMPQDDLNNFLGYLYYNYRSKDPSLQPFALPPQVKMNVLAENEIDVVRAKKCMPPILKAYTSMGCMVASTAASCDELLKSIDIFIMMETDKINGRYLQFITK